MRRACAEGRKYLGATSPNPSVGAVALNAQGEIIGANAHKRAGTLHAEAGLIADFRARNMLGDIHTLCVTLEPCNHQGRTPPCTEAVIAAGIRRVVIGTRDPNPHVKGGGAERLRTAGIDVTEHIEEEECKQLIHAFAWHTQTGKPWITIKRAFTKEGSMIPPPGKTTFTSRESLKLVHRMRKESDAIITGSGTVLADNPAFTVRHVPDYVNKQRFLAILDRRGRVPESYLAASRGRGFDTGRYNDLCGVFRNFAERGARDVMVEAGPTLSQAVLDSGWWNILVDIHQGAPDRIEVKFNSDHPTPFDAAQFNWEWFLPG